MLAGTLSPMSYLKSWQKPLVFAAFAKDDPLPGIIDLPLTAYRVLAARMSGLARKANETYHSLLRSSH
jgi:D-aspartate ligase